MNQKIWDLYAPVYEKAMRLDRRYYQYMYDRIPAQISGKEVLEIATGPGLLAKHVAHPTKRMVATDYSEGMIREAKKGSYPAQLTFAVADATALPYPADSFDVVLIANALHVMPEPELALAEINRVLRTAAAHRPGTSWGMGRGSSAVYAPNFSAWPGSILSTNGQKANTSTGSKPTVGTSPFPNSCHLASRCCIQNVCVPTK